jgi:hypothetical protein
MTTLTNHPFLIKINNPPPPGSKAAAAWINTDEDSDITSKYTLKCYLPNEETGIPEQWTYNINADVSLKRFKSTDAPDERALAAEYSNTEQFLGYDRFNGSIGSGRIYIKTEKGIKIKGTIEGGPQDGQTFVGAGTWTKG